MAEYIKQKGSPTSPFYPDSSVAIIRNGSLNRYLNFLYDQKITTAQDKRAYEGIEQSAGMLIALIKKEYHLK